MKTFITSKVLTNSILLIAFALALSQLTPTNAIANGGTVVACADKKTGILRMAYKKCTSKENQVSWNQSGTQGPAGARGPVGPQGLTGPSGNTGATGAQGIQGLQGIQGPLGLDQVDLKVVSFNTDANGQGVYNTCLDGMLISTGTYCGLDVPSTKDAFIYRIDYFGGLTTLGLVLVTKNCSQLRTDWNNNTAATDELIRGTSSFKTQLFLPNTDYSTVRSVGLPILPKEGNRCLLFPWSVLYTNSASKSTWYIALSDKT